MNESLSHRRRDLGLPHRRRTDPPSTRTIQKRAVVARPTVARPTAIDRLSNLGGKQGMGFIKTAAHSWCYICSTGHAFDQACARPRRVCPRCRKSFVPSVDRVCCSRRCRDTPKGEMPGDQPE